MKKICWEGNSKEILRGFPDSVRRDLGTGLMFLQLDAVPQDAKPLKTGMPGTWELRAKDQSGQYRAVYVCILRDQIHVLHCFKKTTAKTARADVQLAQIRYRNLKQRISNEEE